MIKLIILACLACIIGLAGCATNPGLDRRVTCTLEGKAQYIVTYGPIAFTNPVPDADVICAKVQTAQVVTVSPAAVPASAPR